MVANALLALRQFGQSVWLDYLRRSMLKNGELRQLIDEDGVCGVTSNPAILEKAIVEHDDYDAAIIALASDGADARTIYETLVLEDVRNTADLLRPVYDQTQAQDGFVSLEVSPHLAYDTEATVREARRLWAEFGRPNAMIKVPATREGLPAMRQLVADGLNVNATLLFGLERYCEVADAFIAGLEARAETGRPVNRIASVASFFLSRIDVLVDKQLDALGRSEEALQSEARTLRGGAAVASARLAYQDFKGVFSGARWDALASRGARPQRLLWASTSTKDPAYSDVKYVEALIGPQTVNTMPMETLGAYRDHGVPALRLEDNPTQAREVLDRLAAAGIDLAAVTEQLLREGVQKFIDPFEILFNVLERRSAGLHP